MTAKWVIGVRAGVPVLLLLVAFSGCVGSQIKISANPGSFTDSKEGLFLTGLIVDEEILPIEGALVTIDPGGLSAVTNAGGSFQLGPLEPGTYTVIAQRDGYEPITLQVTLSSDSGNRILLSLERHFLGTPYHLTEIYVTHTLCATPSAPCVPINTVTSQNITPDRPDLLWKIPAAGLANMLYEMAWKKQLTSGDKSFTTRNPEGLFLGCSDTAGQYPTKLYFGKEGPSPVSVWAWPGKLNEGGCEKFKGEEGTKYYTVNRPRSRNATIPLGVVLDEKVTNYLTFFFYLEGREGFTAIRDS